MKFIALFTLISALGLAACQAPQNSVTNDPLQFPRGGANGAQGATLAGNAQAVLARNCVQCHANLGRWNESEFRTQLTSDGRNWIVAGELGSSALYQKLRGASAEGNMPPSGPLTSDERNTIATWIQSLKPIPALQPTPTPTLVTPPAPTLTPAQQRWKNVQNLVNNRCTFCHDEMEGLTESSFLTEFFVAGRPDQSFLLRRLRGVGPNGDMPPIPRPALTPEEVAVFSDWVISHGPSAGTR